MPQMTAVGLDHLKEKGMNLEVGRYSYGVPSVSWAKTDTDHRLTIGRYCSIAAGVTIYVGRQGRHTIDFLSTYPMGMIYPGGQKGEVSKVLNRNLDVTIGSDVWLGRDAMIMAGVTIGDGAVVGSRAVVTKDVPPYAIAVGAPAKVSGKRFDDEVIAQLLLLRWWEFPDDLIEDNIGLFSTSDMNTVIEKLGELKANYLTSRKDAED